MYEIIGINYERGSVAPSIIHRPGRTPEIISEVYEHGKKLWDGGDCSKYLVALMMSGRVVDYNRPDYWNFENRKKFNEETSHFPTWDYQESPCPYKDKEYRDGESQEYLTFMCGVYQNILNQEGAIKNE
jgi:hypothetical protein